MMIVHNTDEHRAFLVGRQSALRTSSEAVDQLTEQIIAARAELQEARAEHAERMAEARAHFEREAEAMRQELEQAIAELQQLRAIMFFAWTPETRPN